MNWNNGGKTSVHKGIRTSDIRVVFTLFTIGVIAYIWGRDIGRICFFQIPNEIRGGANEALVLALSQGINPYRSLICEGGNPSVFYMYPILNNLIGSVAVKLTGLPVGLVLLLLNFLWTALTALLIAKIVGKITNNFYLCTLAFLMSHYCGWRYTNVSAFPDMLAVLGTTLIMYLCVRERITGRTVFLLSFLTVFCFYSKQYAAVVGLPVVVFLIIRKQLKLCFCYMVETAVLLGLSVFFIYLTMPFYFIGTLLLVSGSADNDFRWAVTQFIKIGKIFFLSFLAIFIWAIQMIRSRKFQLDYVWICFGIMGGLLLYFGQNEGAHLSYYLQLWLPSVIILSLCAVDAFAAVFKKKWQLCLIYAIAMAGAVCPYQSLNTPLLSDQQLQNWEKAMEIADKSDNMLATPQMASYAVQNGKYMYDYGQNQYIFRQEMEEFWRNAEDSELLRAIFPELKEFRKVHENYREQILVKLYNKEYDVLMLVEGVGFTRDFDEFQKIRDEKYKLTETIEIETGSWKWDMEIWR